MKPQQDFPTVQSRKVVMEMENGRGPHGGRNWVGWLVGAAWVGSILASTVLVVVCVGLVRDVGSLREELNSLRVTVDRHQSPLSQESEEKWIDGTEGTPLLKLLKHGRTRRNAYNQNRAVTQLNGFGTNGQFLTWKRPHQSTYLNTFHYETVSSTNPHVEAIKIQTAGIYAIFSQVAFNGRSTMTDISECGHEVVRTSRGGRVNQTIQKSIITQDGEGRQYYRNNMNGMVYPLDTHSTFGVFHLGRHDRLRVQISQYCRSFARINMNQNYTHIGAFLINEL